MDNELLSWVDLKAAGLETGKTKVPRLGFGQAILKYFFWRRVGTRNLEESDPLSSAMQIKP